MTAAYYFAASLCAVFVAVIVFGHYASRHRPRIPTLTRLQIPRATWRGNRKR